ncbi:MAG: Tyrosine--tRNA ligase [Parcubacteria group bacterium]|nr:Tyrosine--tRNA ligase [Parcubacteria group bacterium]
MSTTDVQEILSRSVGSFIDPDNSFREKLEKKVKGEYEKDIVVKLGIDPTRPDIHLGHAVILRKLRQFQDLGCKVIFLVGDVTALIGDPTGKSKVRPELEMAEIQRNMQTFLDQVGKILRTDDSVFSWITNSEWFMNVVDISVGPDSKVEIAPGQFVDPNSFVGKAAIFDKTRRQVSALGMKSVFAFSFVNFLSVLRHITHSRLIARDMFQDRLREGAELYMHEMMYPVLQGMDSVAIARIYGSCDLEIGGTDQTFNMLMGRDIMQMSKLPEQAVMSLEIIPGLDGKEKMSKSLDNYIAITDSANDMYGKVMSIPDTAIATFFRLATYAPLAEIEELSKELAAEKTNPRDVKMRLARQIVAEYHGEEASLAAEANFVETFSKGGVPTDIQTVKAAKGDKFVDILLSQKIIESKSEWRRLVEEGAVTNTDTGEKIGSPDAALENSLTLKIGKRRFIKIETL